jgi:hypothetical protein
MGADERLQNAIRSAFEGGAMKTGAMKIILGVWILAAVSAVALATEVKPDFSGTWKLDTQLSRFSKEVPAPKSMTMIIEQRDPKVHLEIKTETKEGAQDHAFDLTTDGTEATQTNAGVTSTASVTWGAIDGTRMMLTIKQQTPGGTVVATRRMKLGSSGKILTTVLTIRTPSGPQEAYEFFSRE